MKKKISAEKKLRQTFKHVNTFLKHHKKAGSSKQLFCSPLFLIIGPQGAGKTSLLSGAEVNYLLSKKSKPHENISTTLYYEWWVTKNAIFIDTPGNLFSLEVTDATRTYYLLPKLLKRYSYQHQLQGIILILSLDEIFHSSKPNNLKICQNISDRLAEICKHFSKKIPITCIFNKCDLITGFKEFFGELSLDERWQPWGFNLDFYKNTVDLTTKVQKEFGKLMTRLNDQLLWRMQHETNIDKRCLINDFPLQMSKVGPYIKAILEQIFKNTSNNYKLNNVFFTSANNQAEAAQASYNVKPNQHNLINIQHPKNKAFFAHKIINHLLPHQVTYKSYSSYFRIAVCFSSVLLFCFFSFVWIKNFDKQIKTLSMSRQTLVEYHLLEKKLSHIDFNEKIKFLSLLHKTYKSLNQINNTIWFPGANKKISYLQQMILNDYQKSLQKILFPIIKQDLEKSLGNTNTSESLLYSSLKSYIMIGNICVFNSDYMQQTMRKIWAHLYSDKTQKELAIHLPNLLSIYNKSQPVNNTLIMKIREKLRTFNTAQLAYLILENDINYNQLLSLNLNSNPVASSVFAFVDNDSSLSSIYTANKFNLVVNKLIKQYVEEASSGNWVVGKKHVNNKEETKKIIDNTVHMYIVRYGKVWSKFLSNIAIVNFTQLRQLDNTLNKLLVGSSPLSQLVEIIKTNIPEIVVSNNSTLLNLLHNNKSQVLQLMLNDLASLRDYISPFVIPNNTDKEIFSSTSYRLKNYGKNDTISKILSHINLYPDPIKNWIYTITMNTWQLMLYHTQDYINSIWQKEVVPQYQAQISTLFPFDIHANNNISLDSFNYFFAPYGLLDTFCEKYLFPFIDTSQMPWKLKNLNGVSLQISQNTLNNLMKITQIKNNYFPNNGKRLSINCEIILSDISDNLRDIIINVGKQKLDFNSEENQSQHLSWPDNVNSNIVKLILIDKHGNEVISITKKGPWALLKILKLGDLRYSNKDHIYYFSFNIKESHVSFKLKLNNNAKPFFLNQFSKLKLPLIL